MDLSNTSFLMLYLAQEESFLLIPFCNYQVSETLWAVSEQKIVGTGNRGTGTKMLFVDLFQRLWIYFPSPPRKEHYKYWY